MPYVETVWVNDTSPAMNATNLNKLTTEIKAQALEQGISHTLPTWANGVAPAVTDAVPWNELERVVDLVAASVGLSYTPTVWSDDWIPARNATRLNKLEAQAAANRAELDEGPPSAYVSPVGAFSNAAYFPATNQQHYSYVSSVGTEGPLFTGQHCFYRTGLTATGTTNISEATALANGWEMRDTNGNVMENAVYGNALCDPGDVGYQAAWNAATYARLQQLGESTFDGVWVDDVNPRPSSISGGAIPAAYPTNASYETALATFAAAMGAYFHARGKTVAWNTSVPSDDNVSAAAVWWPKCGPHIDYITKERWLFSNGHVRYRGTSNYDQHWDSHRGMHTLCQSVGCGFLPLCSALGGPGGTMDRYSMGTFLLDWTGTAEDGFVMYSPADNWTGTTDPWSSFKAQVIALGLPTAPPVSAGDTVSRAFEGGSVSVNPVLGTMTLT